MDDAKCLPPSSPRRKAVKKGRVNVCSNRKCGDSRLSSYLLKYKIKLLACPLSSRNTKNESKSVVTTESGMAYCVKFVQRLGGVT